MEAEMKVDTKLIKALREERAWSQEHLASVADLSARTVQRLEADGNASLESKMAIAAAFVAQRALPQWPALAVGAGLTVASAWYCMRALVRLSAAEDSLPAVRRILRLGRR